ncbi:hypothetical protein OIE73_03745 [Streptomyces hirsutus]|uniref:PepSY domain-containing protein n=2 Tax=Streptomyces hirsutus TaxID=35620 RepID=A0ABZ1GFQ9_9ACTN|nr:hypothetical protein [Streptomyces hirsutus]WSD04957.1 hypothetical protein OIE73_03745 [Streptomyces hirsutus]
MTRPHGRWLPLAVLTAALAALIASVVWVSSSTPNSTWRPGPKAMMGTVSSTGPIRTLTDADRAADRFADRWNLHVGEVMQFSNGYYAELLDRNGRGATEVLINPDSRTVQLEFGPAMMWNTSYGMTPARKQTAAAAIGPDQAVRMADQWLKEHRTGLHAAEPDRFPGYYTLHTLRGDRIVGMLSVNATSGDVWYHTWHGRFLQVQEHPAST